MRFLVLTTATALVATFAASSAQADSYYGPMKNGDQCWHRQVGNSLGYWEQCKSEGASASTANATMVHSKHTKTKRR